MSSRFSKIPLSISLTAVVFGAALPHCAAATAPVSFCVDSSSPLAQMDAAVAKAVASEVGSRAQVVYFSSSVGDEDEGFALEEFRTMAQTRCDLIMGFPLDSANQQVPAGLPHTRSYLDTGFVLVMQQTPRGLDQLPKGAHVAVTYNTPPQLLFVDRPEIHPIVYDSDAAGLEALVARAVNAAVIWQPSLANYQAVHAEALNYQALNAPYTRWVITALYAPQAEVAAKTFDAALTRLEASGKLEQITHDYALPVTVVSADEPVADNEQHEAQLAESSEGLYATEQAAHGAKVYAEQCAVCHGDHLQGLVGPTLKGPAFASKDYEYTIGAILGYISTMMPSSAPGSLTHQQYADLMAFLLQQNGYPAGSEPLTYDEAIASEHPLISKVSGEEE